MLDFLIEKFHDPRFMTMVFAAIAAAATVYTLITPLFAAEGLSKRMKAVASERERIQPKDIQVCGSGIPMREVMRIDHDASSCEQDSPPRKNYALHRPRRNVMG